MTTPPARRATPAPARRPATDRSADLTADLLADLTAPAALPSAPPAAAPGTAPTPGGTPALSVTVTPLRWRSPSFTAPARGVGVGVRIGPLRVEVAF